VISLVVRAYQAGDLAKIPNPSFDYSQVLGLDIEQQLDGIWTVWLGEQRMMVFGYALFMPGVMGVFSVLDRIACLGHGRKIVAILRKYLHDFAEVERCHRVEATCSPTDKAAAVFLRAVGMRQESVLEAAAPDGSDLLQFKLIIRGILNHGRNQETPSETA
jgi:hypothetical protein